MFFYMPMGVSGLDLHTAAPSLWPNAHARGPSGGAPVSPPPPLSLTHTPFSLPDLADVLRLGILTLLAYGGAVACIGAPFLPPTGPAWCVVLVWAASSLGGLLLSRTVPAMPALLGQIAAGVLLKNVPGDAVRGLPKSWSKEIRYGALAAIFLRSGLEQDIAVFKRVGPLAVRLLLIPGITEALVAAGVAVAVFKMPVLLALTLGFILKPVDPAIVMTIAVAFQRRGAGIRAGIPSLVVAAGSFDDLVALIFFSIFSSLAIPSSGSLAWAIASAPLQVVFGVLGAFAGTLLCSATRLWTTPRSRTAAVLAWCLAAMYAAVRFEFSGAGILAAMGLGVGVGSAWAAGWPGKWATVGPLPGAAALTEHHVGLLWTYVASPLLFGLVGTLVDRRKIAGAAIPRSLAVIGAGWAARMPATFLSISGSHLTVKEKLFVVLTWLPKATVQAALATAPLDRMVAEGKGAAALEQGENVVVCALLAVLVCGPLGVAATALLGPRLLPPDGAGGGGGGGAGSGAAAGVAPAPRRRLPSDAAAALAGAGAPSRRRPAAMMSMPAVLPEVARVGGVAQAAAGAKRPGSGGGAVGGEEVGGGGAPAKPAAAAATAPEEEAGAGAGADEDEDDDAYDDSLLKDLDPQLHALVEAVDLEAWLLGAGGEGGAGGVGAAEARASAGRLRAAAVGLRRRLVEREPGQLERVDGARDFFRRLDRAGSVGGSLEGLPLPGGGV